MISSRRHRYVISFTFHRELRVKLAIPGALCSEYAGCCGWWGKKISLNRRIPQRPLRLASAPYYMIDVRRLYYYGAASHLLGRPRANVLREILVASPLCLLSELLMLTIDNLVRAKFLHGHPKLSLTGLGQKSLVLGRVLNILCSRVAERMLIESVLCFASLREEVDALSLIKEDLLLIAEVPHHGQIPPILGKF